MSTPTASTKTDGVAVEVARAYFEAWTSKNLDQAMTYVAENVVCDAPGGRLEGADAYRDFMGPFTQILVEARLLASFGDDETAVVVYDTKTLPVESAPGAECVTVKDGKITYSRFIFDRAPFQAARDAAK